MLISGGGNRGQTAPHTPVLPCPKILRGRDLAALNQSVEAQCHGRCNITDNLTAARPQYDGYGVRLVPWVAVTTEAMFERPAPGHYYPLVHRLRGIPRSHGGQHADQDSRIIYKRILPVGQELCRFKKGAGEGLIFSRFPGKSCTSSLRLIPPPSKSGKMALHHITMRGHGHDSAPCLLPTRAPGTPVALCHPSLPLAKSRRVVTSTTGRTPTPQVPAPTRQRTHTLRGPYAETSLCRVCTRGQPSPVPASTATRADAADQPTPVCHRHLEAFLSS